MKRRAIVIFFALMLFAPDLTFAAQSSPEAVVREMLTQMKKTKDLQVVLNYVHWETAFRELPEKDRRSLKVRTPAELRERYRKLIVDPASVARVNSASGLPEAQAQIVDTVSHAMSQGFAFTVQEFKRRVIFAEYKIGKSTVTGDQAVVPVTAISQGEVERRNVPFRNIQGRWFLPSFQSVDKDGYLRDALAGNLWQRLRMPM